MTITPGKLRGLTQPTIMLRMDAPVAEAPGEHQDSRTVFSAGMYVLAQYVGNGRLLLTPLDAADGHSSAVVMASALNTTSSILDGSEVSNALDAAAAREAAGQSQSYNRETGELTLDAA